MIILKRSAVFSFEKWTVPLSQNEAHNITGAFMFMYTSAVMQECVSIFVLKYTCAGHQVRSDLGVIHV